MCVQGVARGELRDLALRSCELSFGHGNVAGCRRAYAAFLLELWAQSNSQRDDHQLPLGVFAVIVPMLRPEMGLAVVVTLFALLVLWQASRPYIAVSTALATFVGLEETAYFFVGLAMRLPLPLPFYIKQGGSAAPGWTDLQGFLKYSVVLSPVDGGSWIRGIRVVAQARKRHARNVSGVISRRVARRAAPAIAVMGFGFRYFMPVLAIPSPPASAPVWSAPELRHGLTRKL